MAHSLELPDFDDEPTVIQVRPEELSTAAAEAPSDGPPPLPFPLARARAQDEAWWVDLPEAARRVLAAAAGPAESWPRAPRIDGAVAEPVTRIPSLEVRRHA